MQAGVWESQGQPLGWPPEARATALWSSPAPHLQHPPRFQQRKEGRKGGRKEGKKEGRKEQEVWDDEGSGRKEDREEGRDSKDMRDLVCAHSPEHRPAPYNATCPSGPTTVR